RSRPKPGVGWGFALRRGALERERPGAQRWAGQLRAPYARLDRPAVDRFPLRREPTRRLPPSRPDDGADVMKNNDPPPRATSIKGSRKRPGRSSEKDEARETDAKEDKLSRKDYDRELKKLHVELVRLQEWVKKKGLKVCIVFEGRDGAGKGGTIKAITER